MISIDRLAGSDRYLVELPANKFLVLTGEELTEMAEATSFRLQVAAIDRENGLVARTAAGHPIHLCFTDEVPEVVKRIEGLFPDEIIWREHP